ncbi:sensor histidine kinase [Roseomonas sp. KE2513]|nr:sensor histidine kinase [Roseomonas sp. KE2513]
MPQGPFLLLERLRSLPWSIRWFGAGALPAGVAAVAVLMPTALSSAHLQLLLLISTVLMALLLGLAAGLAGATIAFGLMLLRAVEREAGGNWSLSLTAVFDAFLWFAVAKLIVALIAALQGAIVRSVQAEGRSRDDARRTELLLVEQAHRVSNDLNSLVSMLQMQASTEPEAADALNAAANRVLVLGRLHGRLSSGADPQAVVDSRLFLEGLLGDVQSSLLGLRSIVLTSAVEAHPLPLARAGDLGLVVNELVTNALKHAFPGGREGIIRVCFRRDADLYELTVTDNGVGYASGRPQQSDDSTGLGNRILRALAAQLGGRLDVASGDVGGTVSKLRFPLPLPEAGLTPAVSAGRSPEADRHRHDAKPERLRRTRP